MKSIGFRGIVQHLRTWFRLLVALGDPWNVVADSYLAFSERASVPSQNIYSFVTVLWSACVSIEVVGLCPIPTAHNNWRCFWFAAFAVVLNDSGNGAAPANGEPRQLCLRSCQTCSSVSTFAVIPLLSYTDIQNPTSCFQHASKRSCHRQHDSRIQISS